MRVVHCGSAAEIASMGEAAALLHFNPSDFETQQADIHLCALSESGEVQAHCSLWWKHVPAYEQHRVGVVGHYAAATDLAAIDVLAESQKRLREARCTLAIGPMDGNTWRRYRFVTERGNEPAFFLEPTNLPEWPLQFEKAGFSPLAFYFSSLNSHLTRPDPRVDAIATRMAAAEVVVRFADADLRRELEAIYAVSQVSFRQNFLYTEIPKAEFISMYEPVLPVARPELVLIAERDSQCVGYLFAIPDLTQKTRGRDVDTFIIKTVSILPQPELRGLGTLLVSRAQQFGRELGFQRCVHALMFQDNISLNISRHYATVMRKYTLYSKDLAK